MIAAPACINGVWPSLRPLECGAEEQTVDHVALHGLTVLDDETMELLLNTSPEI